MPVYIGDKWVAVTLSPANGLRSDLMINDKTLKDGVKVTASPPATSNQIKALFDAKRL